MYNGARSRQHHAADMDARTKVSLDGYMSLDNLEDIRCIYALEPILLMLVGGPIRLHHHMPCVQLRFFLVQMTAHASSLLQFPLVSEFTSLPSSQSVYCQCLPLPGRIQ